MVVRVFQVDRSPRMMPYAFEHEAIRRAGGEFVVDHCTSETEIVERAQGAEILFVAGSRLVTPVVMDALPRCRLIARWAVGYDIIDVEAATARGIAVANSPSYCSEEVAEHTIGLLFAVARRFVVSHERMRRGEWQHPGGQIHRLATRTLGIIGCGRIGSKVAARALGLGIHVVAHDAYRSSEALRATGVTPRTFDEVLAEADYVTVHVPLSAETRHLIDASALAKMKPEAMLINTSRGPVIDESALIEALSSGRLAGAALDVFEEEPLDPASPLLSLEQVVLTPHYAAYSVESIDALRREICQTAASWIADGWSENVVNPEVREKLRPRSPR
ncbi:MAG TPA: C-terminal binding protein [Thermomicrobiales bacterium]|jgi:D-3-phosphoglycerate dehydrogenase